MNIQLDDGFFFGLGVFETICLKEKNPVFLEWHLERMNNSLKQFNISQKVEVEEVKQWLKEKENIISSLKALKIVVSEKNKLFLLRDNPYNKEKITKGFNLEYSNILRNEKSKLVYHKSLNYGENILEKRSLAGTNTDEVIFLNTKGQICEGSVCNIFFVKEGQIYTPKVECGLLAGILRRFIIEEFKVIEKEIYPEDIYSMDECFVTNSLMGIMPVNKLGKKSFNLRTYTKKCMERYLTQTEKSPAFKC